MKRREIDTIVKEFRVQVNACDLKPSYNVAPTQDVAVVIADGAKKLIAVRWASYPRGLVISPPAAG